MDQTEIGKYFGGTGDTFGDAFDAGPTFTRILGPTADVPILEVICMLYRLTTCKEEENDKENQPQSACCPRTCNKSAAIKPCCKKNAPVAAENYLINKQDVNRQYNNDYIVCSSCNTNHETAFEQTGKELVKVQRPYEKASQARVNQDWNFLNKKCCCNRCSTNYGNNFYDYYDNSNNY